MGAEQLQGRLPAKDTSSVHLLPDVCTHPQRSSCSSGPGWPRHTPSSWWAHRDPMSFPQAVPVEKPVSCAEAFAWRLSARAGARFWTAGGRAPGADIVPLPHSLPFGVSEHCRDQLWMTAAPATRLMIGTVTPESDSPASCAQGAAHAPAMPYLRFLLTGTCGGAVGAGAIVVTPDLQVRTQAQTLKPKDTVSVRALDSKVDECLLFSGRYLPPPCGGPLVGSCTLPASGGADGGSRDSGSDSLGWDPKSTTS